MYILCAESECISFNWLMNYPMKVSFLYEEITSGNPDQCKGEM